MKLLQVVMILTQVIPGFKEDGNNTEILCRINDEIVTKSDIELEMKKNNVPISEQGIKRYLINMVKEKILLMEAAKIGLEVTDEEIDREIELELKRGDFKSKEDFKQNLRIYHNMTLFEYRKDKKVKLLIHKMISHAYYRWLFDPQATVYHEYVSPAELRRFYKNNMDVFNTPGFVSLFYLTLKYSDKEEKEEKMKLAQSILRKIESHTDFRILVQHYSDLKIMSSSEKELKKIKIDRLYRDSKMFKDSMMDLVFGLDVGKVSSILDDGNNLYIVKIWNKVSENNMSFEEAQPRIKRLIESEKRKRNEDKLIREVLKSVKVEPEEILFSS